MNILAHVTSFDLPSLLVAFSAGLILGAATLWTFMGRKQ